MSKRLRITTCIETRLKLRKSIYFFACRFEGRNYIGIFLLARSQLNPSLNVHLCCSRCGWLRWVYVFDTKMVEKIKHPIVPRENCQEGRPPGAPLINFPGAPLSTQSGPDWNAHFILCQTTSDYKIILKMVHPITQWSIRSLQVLIVR